MSKPSLPKFWVIIPAAGIGSRMQMDIPKQYLQINNKTILEHTVSCFLGHSAFHKVYIGISADDRYFKTLGLEKIPNVDVFTGGRERSETVLNGLNYIADQACAEDWVWVHDAARPCLSSAEIKSLIQALEEQSSGLVLGVPVADTLKRVSVDENNKSTLLISETVSRERLWRAMTPQVFKYADLYEALNFCHKDGRMVTDEASAIEAFGMQAHIIQGSDQNIKVTVPEDLAKVRNFFKLNTRELNPHKSRKTLKQNDMSYPRIGTGFDVHAFGIGSFITLGGVEIPYEKGLVAHSDGDVLLHAIMDAMLGALALGDIGKHFPDTDLEWKGADSRALLRAVNKMIQDRGFKLGNLDSTIIAQAPKMSPFIEKMQNHLAEDLGVNMEDVSVKATTTEKLGFTGRKEGVACQASVVLVPYISGVEK